jgi:aminoglycoside 6'-N-acetyltransferase
LTRHDFPRLSQWLDERHVAAFWREPGDPPELEERYGPAIDRRDPTECFIAEIKGGDAVGFCQRYRFSDEPTWAALVAETGVATTAAGIDYLIGPAEWTGRGVGTALISQLTAKTFEEFNDIDWIVVDVAQDNRHSWRALERVGFERRWAGVLPSGHPSDDGPVYLYTLARRDVAQG